MYLGADAWQSPNGFNILGVVLYRLVELNTGVLNLEAVPLDFIWLAKIHTGEYLADTVRAVVEKFGIQDKVGLLFTKLSISTSWSFLICQTLKFVHYLFQICGIFTDNASNNAAMVSEMKNFKWARFKGNQHWIRFYAHILNLMVQSILQPFGTVNKKQSTATETEDDDKSSASSDDSDLEDAEDQIRRWIISMIYPLWIIN